MARTPRGGGSVPSGIAEGSPVSCGSWHMARSFLERLPWDRHADGRIEIGHRVIERGMGHPDLLVRIDHCALGDEDETDVAAPALESRPCRVVGTLGRRQETPLQ